MRRFTDDPQSVPAESRKTAAQEVAQLELMSGQLAKQIISQ